MSIQMYNVLTTSIPVFSFIIYMYKTFRIKEFTFKLFCSLI